MLNRADNVFEENLLFIMRVKRELKRVYINGCRYNDRLNAETEGSKTPRACDHEERGRGEGAFCSCLDDENDVVYYESIK